jgi:isocitrate dehydrogenase kinase/phosphatase
MTFHNLRFHRSDFDEGLLEELLREAPSSVRKEDSYIVFRYLYAAREITPLDVFLMDENVPQQARAEAAVDYGYAIKDLAAAGIFVGDYMPKNFGVNRLGRVFLYDYDDLDELVCWNFRKMPETPWWAETLPYEDWLSKGEWDVFPEHDFRVFTVPARQSDSFLTYHSDLLEPEYWNNVKNELLSGIVPDFYPYPQRKRLRTRLDEDRDTYSRHVGRVSQAGAGDAQDTPNIG